eukprot:XP_011674320.1 PREDICTED: importin-13-like [Strongylocentrotus purpuratus]
MFAFRSIAEGGDYGDDQCAANLLQLIGQINMSHVKLASTALYMLEFAMSNICLAVSASMFTAKGENIQIRNFTMSRRPSFGLHPRQTIDQEMSFESQLLDTVQGLCRLAVTLGENHTKLLVESTGEDKQHAMEFTSLVLGFTALPGHYPVDETISNMPFGFWYLLQDDIVSADTDKLESYVQTYAPVFLQLVEVMLRKVQYPDDEEYDGWTEDEKEQFRCYRQDIGDTLVSTYKIIDTSILQDTVQGLCRLAVTLGENHTKLLVESTGEDKQHAMEFTSLVLHVEACLFAFRSIAEGGDYGDDQCAANLLQLIGQINMSHVKLASTALYMLGAYSEWLTDMPEALGSIIPVLLSGLNDAELAAPATMSLKDIASDCIPGMRAHAEVILTASQQALMANVLKAITGGAPRNVVDNLSDILFSLNKHAFTKFSGWITDIMLNTTVELPRATKEQREHFGSTILR